VLNRCDQVGLAVILDVGNEPTDLPALKEISRHASLIAWVMNPQDQTLSQSEVMPNVGIPWGWRGQANSFAGHGGRLIPDFFVLDGGDMQLNDRSGRDATDSAAGAPIGHIFQESQGE